MMLSILSRRNVINSASKLRSICQFSVKNIKYNNSVFCEQFHSSRCKFIIKNTRENNKSKVEIDQLHINTHVQNNVFLYKYENTKDFILLKMTFFGWIFFDVLILLISYDSKYISTFNENISWKEYFKKNGLGIMNFIFSTTLGPLFALLLYHINKNVVKYIILHKGGKIVSIISNHAFKTLHTVTVPVNEVKIGFAREKMKNYLPMKVKGRRWLYFIDSEGEFLNKKLFDYTVGKLKPW